MFRRAALALLLAAGASRADVVLNLGNANLAGGDMVVQTPQLSGTLLAVVVSFDFAPDITAQNNGSWASDAALAIESPITNPVQWGGYDLLLGGPQTVFIDDWSFFGESEPGPYTDIRTDVPIGLFGTGTWAVAFGNAWSESTAVQYNSITVTLVGLQAIPAPSGAAALLTGLVPLARRRRR
jgi:hypothetical protein